MGHARCYLGLMLLLLASPSYAATQGLPVYVATGTPVGSCIGSRIWMTDTNPSITYCCLNSVWVACTASVGPKGDTGATGPTGPRGPTGLKGDKGDTGATGARGLTGAAGTAGATGATGPQGAPGSNGLDGLDGTNGSKGDQGEPGSTKTCTAGYAVQDASTCTNTIDNANNAEYAAEAQYLTSTSSCSAGQAALGIDQYGGAAGCWTIPTSYAATGTCTGANVIQAISTSGVTCKVTPIMGECSIGLFSTGIRASDGATMCATAPAGPTGPQGPTGATGATGPQGSTGATGAQGPTGATGAAGSCTNLTLSCAGGFLVGISNGSAVCGYLTNCGACGIGGY